MEVEFQYYCADCDAPGDAHYAWCRYHKTQWSKVKHWATVPRFSHLEMFLIAFIVALIKAATKWMF